MSDRLAGSVMAAAALLYLIEARTFETGFIADPIGPKAFPTGIGILSLLVGVSLAWRRGKGWTSAAFDRRALVVLVAVSSYALVLELLGFVLASTLEMFALAVVFRGPRLVSLAAGLGLSLALYVVFERLLAIPLPRGWIFGGA